MKKVLQVLIVVILLALVGAIIFKMVSGNQQDLKIDQSK
jgi:uncharacterized protein YxeA